MHTITQYAAAILLLLSVSKLASARLLRDGKQQAVITHTRNGIAENSAGFPVDESKYPGKTISLDDSCELVSNDWGTYYMWRFNTEKNFWKIGYSSNERDKARKKQTGVKNKACETSRLVRYYKQSFEPDIKEFFNIVKCKIVGKVKKTGLPHQTPETCMDYCFAEMVYAQGLIQKLTPEKAKHETPEYDLHTPPHKIDKERDGITEWFENTKYSTTQELGEAIAKWFMDGKCTLKFKQVCESCNMKPETPGMYDKNSLSIEPPAAGAEPPETDGVPPEGEETETEANPPNKKQKTTI